MTDITDAELGDPRVPRPTDPKELTLRIGQGTLQAIVATLNEMPTKFARHPLEDIERQVDKAVLDCRRAQLVEERKRDAERIAAAADKRAKKEARRAARAHGPRVNGSQPEAAK